MLVFLMCGILMYENIFFNHLIYVCLISLQLHIFHMFTGIHSSSFLNCLLLPFTVFMFDDLFLAS